MRFDLTLYHDTADRHTRERVPAYVQVHSLSTPDLPSIDHALDYAWRIANIDRSFTRDSDELAAIDAYRNEQVRSLSVDDLIIVHTAVTHVYRIAGVGFTRLGSFDCLPDPVSSQRTGC